MTLIDKGKKFLLHLHVMFRSKRAVMKQKNLKYYLSASA